MNTEETNTIETKVKEVFKLLKGMNTKTAEHIIKQCSYNLNKTSEIVDLEKVELRLSTLI